jgi:hypothetical protein
MYKPDTDLVRELKEWCKNNPLNKDDYKSDNLPLPGWNKGMPAWNKGIPNTWGDKISKTTKGIPKRHEKQMAIARQNAIKRNATMLTCIHCGKINNLGNHKKYHDARCKLITSLA